MGQPPEAREKPYEIKINGNSRIDNYYWLKEKGNEDVISYLKEENLYAGYNISDTTTLAQKLAKEFSQDYYTFPDLTHSATDSVHNGIILFDKNKKGKYPLIFKKNIHSTIADSIIDINSLAFGHKYFDYRIKYSPDYKTLAYMIDTVGNELYYCRFINIINGKEYPETINNITSYCEWSTDGYIFCYVTVNASDLRWDKIHSHKVGKKVINDKLIYFEQNPNCLTYITKDETKKLLIINSESRNSSAEQYLEASKPNSSLKKIHPFSNGLIFKIKPFGSDIYIMTNYKAPNFRILKTSLNAPLSLDNCIEVVAPSNDVSIEDFHISKNFLILEERKQGISSIRVFNLSTGSFNYIKFPDSNYSIYLNDIVPFSDTLEINYSSPITPKLLIKYSLSTNQEKVIKFSLVDTSIFNPENYKLEIIYCKTSDSVNIPITLFYKKTLLRDGNNPILMRAYGAYGTSEDIGFSSSTLSLVNRGFIYAVAHVRGGGEYGEYWHEQGSKLKKKNSINDFISCSDYLIKNKYTSPKLFFISGGSAGGITIGGAIVFHPEYYRGCILRVPFLDVITTMADSTLPNVKIEYEEWGNPYKEVEYQKMLSYSPYDNIKDSNFPSVLIRSSYNDSRVMYWEAAKFTAKLTKHQQLKNNKILLLTDMNGGHLKRNFIKETAEDYEYFLKLAGINK